MNASVLSESRELMTLVDRFESIRAEREARAEAFADGRRPYLIYQTPYPRIYGDVRTSEACFARNLQFIRDSLSVPSDHLPALEPWFGTGVIANVYGCPHIWRDGETPCADYRYDRVEEVRGLPVPDWREGEIARLVMDTIRYMKARTGDAIPIYWTDTQSAHDTATLILDASAVFTACLLEPDSIGEFLSGINRVTLEFSQAQAEAIGDALIKPGRIMASSARFSGITVSDDNLAVGSPETNRRFNLPLDEELGRAMGGIAIHSCGNWTDAMRMAVELVPSCVAVDCPICPEVDPNPCRPEAVRDVMANTGIPVHVRVTNDQPHMIEAVKRLLHPNLRPVIRILSLDQESAERNYGALDELLSAYYSSGRA